ncbi:MAG: GNAT family N-acetyltransferase, partial [Mangrovicoccus sp.]
MTEQSPLPTAWPKAHESLGVLFNDEIAISAGLGLISHPLRFFSAEGNGARAGIGFQLLPGSARDLWMGSYQSLCSSQVGLAGIAHDGATEVLFQRLAWDIAADKSWHRLYIGPFPDWDDATQNFADLLRAQGHDCEAQDRIWYDVTGVTDREDYLSQLSSNARKNIRKQLNRMTKSEDYGYRYYTRDEALEGLRRFVEIDAHSWKASDGEPVGSTPAVLRFYETMVQKFAEQDNVLITVISLGGRDLAATIGFMHNG